MVSVAQLVEPRIVIPVVAGSIPVAHPIFFPMPCSKGGLHGLAGSRTLSSKPLVVPEPFMRHGLF